MQVVAEVGQREVIFWLVVVEYVLDQMEAFVDWRML